MPRCARNDGVCFARNYGVCIARNYGIGAPRTGGPKDTEQLEIIEVQSGSYLGEDDIVRLEDANGRAALQAIPAWWVRQQIYFY